MDDSITVGKMIITSSKIIGYKPAEPSIDQMALVIKRGMIQTVGPTNMIRRLYSGQEVLKFENTVLMPGLVNAHTHLELPALLYAIRAESFSDWILNLIRAKKDLNRKNYVSAFRDNSKLLMQTGTTSVGEICTHGISSDLLKQSGLRTCVFWEIIDMRFGNDESSKLRVQSLNLGASNLLSKGLSPHSPYTVSEDALKKIKKTSQQEHARLCMHIAESKDEIKLLQRKKSGLEKLYEFAKWDPDWAPAGSSSFEYLNRIGFLSPNLLAVHAVQVADKDINLIKRSKVSIAHCPRSNKELGVGRMPLKKFLDAGVTVGLGTDSLASSPSLNMWDEMRYALKIHKKDGITARDIFELATIGGAKALGLDKEIGTLEPGKKADIIAVPLPSKNTGDIYSDLLRETKSCIMSMVNGKIIWTDKKRFPMRDPR